MNGVVKNISALSIVMTGQLPRLTKGQSALLKLIRECVYKTTPLSFDLIVDVYYYNVRKTFSLGEGWHRTDPNDYRSGRYSEYIKYDILECWKKQEKLYYFRSQVRQWFMSNIGILVIKNQLVIIPTIDLGE
jgi:hypothetical protein